MNASFRRRFALVLGALVMTGSMVAGGTNLAYAEGSNFPWDGALCDAMENIDFWDDNGHTVYVVHRGEQIRVDQYYGKDVALALGHGTGHSSQGFYWRHTTGTFRVENCR